MGGYFCFEKECNMKIVLSLIALINLCLSSYANCSTGFACSIVGMENQAIKQFNEYTQNLDRYFSKNIKEDIFFSKKSSDIVYNDLFIFSTVV